MDKQIEKNFEGLKEVYIDIFKLSLKISSINSLDEIQKIMQINLEKEQLLKTASRLKASVVLEGKEKKEIELLIEKIKSVESKNIEKVTKLKEQVAQDLASLNKSISLAGAYKSKNEPKSRLVDTSE